jgi:hypothetical protein
LLGSGGDDDSLDTSTALEFKLVAVHPALEERAELLFALLNFVLQLIIATPVVVELRQGNLKMTGLQGEKGPADGVIARFSSHRFAPGKSSISKDSNLFNLLSMQMMNSRKGSSSSISQREAELTAGISLDDIAWIIGQVASVAKLESSAFKGRKSAETTPGKQTFYSKVSEEYQRTTDAVARRRSKLVSIVEEAQRLTSSAGFNDPSTY